MVLPCFSFRGTGAAHIPKLVCLKNSERKWCSWRVIPNLRLGPKMVAFQEQKTPRFSFCTLMPFLCFVLFGVKIYETDLIQMTEFGFLRELLL